MFRCAILCLIPIRSVDLTSMVVRLFNYAELALPPLPNVWLANSATFPSVPLGFPGVL